MFDCRPYFTPRAATREVAIATRITNHRAGAGKPSLFNWLEWLDEEVRTFPEEANWLEHSPFQFARCRFFMMARYAQLQRPIFDDVLSRELSHWEHQILDHRDAQHILSELNDQQRKELAALLFDTVASLEFYGAHQRRKKRVNKLAGEAPRRVLMLTRKVKKARAALEDLHKYAATLDEVLSWQHVRVTEICLERIRNLKEDPDPESYYSLKTEYPELETPANLGMVQLYWFFRHGCQLSGDEAEVRVARIRNAFWTEHGVSEVPFRPEYQTGESKGCDAVHVTILRFKEGTARRRSP